MANGKIRFGKQSGGELALVIPDGVADTEVIFPESGVLAKTSDINTAGIELKTIATGTATFTAITNNINLTGIGIGVEIGDVIQISGAEDSKNNSEFTIEVITDANNIIVNQAHANKGTTKNVAARVSDTGVTVKLLAKWYNAPLGLGQDWVIVLPNRMAGTTYPTQVNRAISVSIINYNTNISSYILVNGLQLSTFRATVAGADASGNVLVPIGGTYSITPGSTVNAWLELR